MALFSMLSSLFTASFLPPILSSCSPAAALFFFVLFGSILGLLGTALLAVLRHRVPIPLLSAKEFEDLGANMMGFGHKKGAKTRKRRFMAHFGLDSVMVSIVWGRLAHSGWLRFAGIRGPDPKHFLWFLLWMKTYSTEEILAAQVRCDEKTFRKWIWFYAEGIVELSSSVIQWKNRFHNHKRERCLITIDGTDFEIMEPTPFDKRWYSHKFKGPGLRYEIGVCIKTGWIVSFTGPFECGSWPDLKIFRFRVKQMLGIGEKVVADRGYKGDIRVLTPDDGINEAHKKAMGTARARHEAVNGRLKFWNCLKHVWRHDRSKHHLAFRSALVITQLCIENGYDVFQVGDLDDAIV